MSPPRTHYHRYYGVLAPNSPLRSAVTAMAQTELITPVLQVVQRVLTRHLRDGVGFNADEGHACAVTLIQRFGSAANLMMQPQYPRWASD